LEVLY